MKLLLKRLFLALLALIALGSSLGFIVIPSTIINNSNHYGFTIINSTKPANANFTTQAAGDFAAVGVKWARVQVKWLEIEYAQTCSPDPSPCYSWTALDNAVAAANAVGLKVDFPIHAPPSWRATVCNNNLPGATDVANFATAVADRYDGTAGHGTIDAIEIGNEDWFNAPSQCKYTNGNADDYSYAADLYYPVLEAGYNAVSQENTRNGTSIRIGTVASTGSDEGRIQTFLAELFNDLPETQGSTRYADFLNFHYYRGTCGPDDNLTVCPDTNNATAPPFLTEVQDYLSAERASPLYKGVPVWVTEMGWRIDLVSPTTQSGYEKTVLQEAASSGVINKVFIYTNDSNCDPHSLRQMCNSSPTALPGYYMIETAVPTQTWTAGP